MRLAGATVEEVEKVVEVELVECEDHRRQVSVLFPVNEEFARAFLE